MFKHDALKGRVAVVTGGGGVLCSGFSKDLARQGMKVAVLDLRLDAAEKVAKEIRDEGFEAVGIACNVLEKESLESAREIVNKTFGTCDLLLNGAGGNHPSGTTTKDKLELSDLTEKAEGVKTFFDLDAKGIEFVFNLNFLGTLLTTQCFARDMVGKENAAIINVSSMWGITGASCEVHYSASKSAVIGLTKALAREVAPSGITVNAVAPGFIGTDMLKSIPKDLAEKYVDAIPMKKFGTAEDVANVVAQLCSDDFSYMSGQVIVLDGGLSL